MKKTLLWTVSLALMLALTGCGMASEILVRDASEDPPAAVTEANESQTQTEPAVTGDRQQESDAVDSGNERESEAFVVPLLAGYPADQVPIHPDLTIMNTYYQVDGNKDYFADGGYANQYLVGTRTHEDPSAILDYYESLFESLEFKTDQSMRGDIGAYSVLVRHSTMDSSHLIYIEVDVPDSDLSWENRYFQDFPGHLVSVPEELELYKTMRSISDNRGGEYRYGLDYDTQMEAEDFVDFFTSRYEGKEGFETVDPTRFEWEDEGYQVVIRYNLDHGRVHQSIVEWVHP